MIHLFLYNKDVQNAIVTLGREKIRKKSEYTGLSGSELHRRWSVKLSIYLSGCLPICKCYQNIPILRKQDGHCSMVVEEADTDVWVELYIGPMYFIRTHQSDVNFFFGSYCYWEKICPLRTILNLSNESFWSKSYIEHTWACIMWPLILDYNLTWNKYLRVYYYKWIEWMKEQTLRWFEPAFL